MIEFEISKSDDHEFIDLMRKIIMGNIIVSAQSKVFVVKVDNWFSNKWLGYAGGKYHSGLFHTPAQDITLPPFSKRRIISSAYYEYDKDTAEYLEKTPIKDIPEYSRDIPEASRRIRKLFPQVGFFWYSGNTDAQKRGCVMGYIWKDDGPSPWYIGYTYDKKWNPYKMVRIHERELQHFITIGEEHLHNNL